MAVVLAALTALVLIAAGEPARAVNLKAGKGVDEIADCVKANQPQLSAEQTVTMRTVDRTGSARVSNATIYWQKFGEDSKVLIRFSAPEDLRGSALLMLQKGERADMFMYLPELRKVRRLTKRSVSGSMFGTDFSYAPQTARPGACPTARSRGARSSCSKAAPRAARNPPTSGSSPSSTRSTASPSTPSSTRRESVSAR
jgi:hypothetical protein